MRKLRTIGIIALLIVLLVTWLAVTRPPSWRAILYNEMFDACRDESILRARIWMFLGASPDGASDYEVAGGGRVGFEFSSHVHTVVHDRDTRLLRLLLSRGASPDLALGDGTTPLSMAIHNHKAEAVKILLAAGASPRYSDRWTAIDQARSLKFDDLVPVIEPYLEKNQAQQVGASDGDKLPN
jgi:hypothetical protein